MFSQRFQAHTLSTASDEITWKKPKSIIIAIAWSITNTSIILNVFFTGGQALEWYILLLLFAISIFAGILLQDIKAIVLGAFEAIFLTVFLTYTGMIFPILVGGVGDFYQAQTVYTIFFDYIFKFFFPMVPISMSIGAIAGGFVEDWLF